MNRSFTAGLAAALCITLFRPSLTAQEIELISAAQSLHPLPAGHSSHARLSADGRYVVFESKGVLTPDDQNKNVDVYCYDRKTKTLRRLLTSDPNRSNGGPAIDQSGQFIAFHSYPSFMKNNFPSRHSNIYVYDQFKDRYFLLTLGRTGEPHEGEALDPVMNADGRFVLFTSNDENLQPKDGPKTRIRQVYLHDRRHFDFELVSQSTAGVMANRPCADPKMSDDGRYVAYRSAATNLLEDLPFTSLVYHLYLLDRWDSQLIRITHPSFGFDPDDWVVGQYDMDATADILVFEVRQRTGENPIAGLRITNLMLFDRKNRECTLLSEGLFENGSHSPTVSGDGRYVGFVFKGIEEEGDGIVIYDRQDKEWRKVVTGSCHRPVFSKDGKYLAFESDEPDLTPATKPGVQHIYVVPNPFLE